MKYLLIFLTAYLTLVILGCKDNPESSNNNKTPDTTSHSLVWHTDTLGIYPSDLRDVWGTDINNVYAVGFMEFSYSPYTYTAIVHWDGKKWSSLNYHEGYLNSIYGFGKNDIWAVGSWQVDYNVYALITHWDGNNWKTWKLQQYGNLFSIWGTSSSNLYAVGARGLIIHYDGSSWNQQQSSTVLNLDDVWGTNITNIFATGFDDSSGTGVLLEYDGSSWKAVSEGGVSADSLMLYGTFASIWGNSIDKLYLVGALCYEGSPGDWNLSDIPYNSPGENLVGLTAMNRVMGNAADNLFICGDRDLIIHWNGKSWYIYNQFFNKSKQSSLKGIWVKDNNVFIVGYENGLSQAVVYRGTQ